jgi:type II secretory pathway component PulJ
MNLIEVMLATVLFAFSAGSSLQIWGLISLDERQQQQRQQLAERLEGELVSLEALLRQQPRRAGELPPCAQGREQLTSLLNSLPPRAGVQRRITAVEQQDGLLLELAIDGSSLRRQRLYRSAALGLCLPPSSAAAPAAATALTPTPPATQAPLTAPLAGGGNGLS